MLAVDILNIPDNDLQQNKNIPVNTFSVGSKGLFMNVLAKLYEQSDKNREHCKLMLAASKITSHVLPS